MVTTINIKNWVFFFLLSLLDGRIHSSTPSILHKQRIRRLPQILPASQPAVPKQTLPSIWSTKVSLFDPLSLICLWCVNSVAICYSGCWVYPHRLRHGRAGGSWRHVKEVLQAGGRRIVFVDGRYDRLGIGIVSKRVLVCNLHWEFTECRKFILYWLEKKDCASRIFTLRLVIHESTCKKT